MIRRARSRGRAGRKRQARTCKVWPINWNAVELFRRVTSQIRYAGMNGFPTGIEHQAVWPIIDEFVALRGEDCPPGYRLRLFDQFRVLEDAAIKALQERAKENMRQESRK